MANGLRLVFEDSDTLVMASLLHRVKNFVVYLDHENSLDSLNCDDVVAKPINTLPKVISPQKETYIPRKEGEKLSSFYADIPKTGPPNVQGGPGPSGSEPDYFGGTDSEQDSDFVDSDYEVEADDDNLFMDKKR